jgi:hypothetical protein
MNTATDHIERINAYSVETMVDVLSDRSHAQFPIFRPYIPDDVLQNVGTVATIVMDLSVQEFHIRKGNVLRNTFSKYTVE